MMKKSVWALLAACALWLCLVPAALADSLGLYFGAKQVTYRPESGVTLTVKAMRAAESDLIFRIGDQRGNTYTATLPKGRNEIQIAIADSLPQDGSTTFYTLLDGDGYVRRSPGSCAAVPRGAASYSFAEDVYQTYVGREFTCKLRVENPGSLPEGTRVSLRDQQGREVYAFPHQAGRQAYSITFEADDSWYPGKWLSVWVGSRDTADDSALMAVGVTGVKAIWGVNRADNRIAFTMDCGSHNRYVPRILDILDQYHVKITFFVTGKFAAANPDLVREMSARGHEIGNHSWNHPNFDDLSKAEIYAELTRTSDLLESITGRPVTLFRPPYGHLSGQARSIVNALGMQAIRWTHESMDARSEASAANSLKYSTRDMKGGSIILTHTSAGCTVSVLDQILQFYQDNGFEVVPVSQLLLEGSTAIDESGIQYSVETQYIVQ